MPGKSFYDLDYIIEINEQRLEEYRSAYGELMGRLTTIVLIYSAMAIFLVPIMKEVLWGEVISWAFVISFIVYAVFFGISVTNTVRFILPVELVQPEMPILYYGELRLQYEKVINDKKSIEDLIKASYIHELEDVLKMNLKIYEMKKMVYRKALLSALWSILPYIICFGFYISNPKNFVAGKFALARCAVCKL